jgi:hypothetical protein
MLFHSEDISDQIASYWKFVSQHTVRFSESVNGSQLVYDDSVCALCYSVHIRVRQKMFFVICNEVY